MKHDDRIWETVCISADNQRDRHVNFNASHCVRHQLYMYREFNLIDLSLRSLYSGQIYKEVICDADLGRKVNEVSNITIFVIILLHSKICYNF